MKHNSRTEASWPNPAKFVDMLIGKGGNYTFETAVADVVDNAIEAGASHVQVRVDFSSNSVLILDDGRGMSDAVHKEAMKFAAETHTYTDSDLGKFGTGMKAASLSQAECLTVATRELGSDVISVRRLDRNHIRETNDWNHLTLLLGQEQLPSLAQEHLNKTHGTVVIWERLTRLSPERGVPAGEMQNELFKATKATELHMSMIFHRFLSGETASGQSVVLSINGNPILPYDPFARSEKTEVAVKEALSVNGTPMNLVGYVLPPEKEWSSKQAHKEHARPKGWNASQGFYIYRNDRLIQWGTWLKLRQAEPHSSLARISLDFRSALDEVMHVTVDKSKVTLPESVKERLEPMVLKVTKRAKARYSSKSAGLDGGSLPGRTIVGPPGLQKKLTAVALVELLERVAVIHSKTAELDAIKTLVGQENPAVAREIGWKLDDR